jgi:hypothetical protein
MDALQHIAGNDAASVGGLICDAVKRDLDSRIPAKAAWKSDKQIVEHLRDLLSDDLADATDWSDLQMRLGRKGYKMRTAGGGLAVYDSDGLRVCKGSDLGYGCTRLMRRFAAPFPDHRHRYIYRKALASVLG